jgi:hypothetical protein
MTDDVVYTSSSWSCCSHLSLSGGEMSWKVMKKALSVRRSLVEPCPLHKLLTIYQ